MATASTNGIKQLMNAEEKAAQIVAAARKERNEKLKSARHEAMEDVERFRAEKQKELDDMQKKQQSVNHSQDAIQKETDEKIHELQKLFKDNFEDSIQILLDKVGEVDIAVPATYKQRGASGRAN